MKYFLDTEFHEFSKQPKQFGIPIGKPINTIELISIGIVSEDDREYYAICKEFDLKAAWDNEWLRENVLFSIFEDLFKKDIDGDDIHTTNIFKYKELKRLIEYYGKTRSQIAEEIEEFVLQPTVLVMEVDSHSVGPVDNGPPEFYAYYADYDWVVFCWLFGRMLDLPKGFPMYCRDLKQILDEAEYYLVNEHPSQSGESQHVKVCGGIKSLPEYPKQTNEHNALADAKWNKKLYKFLNKL